MDKEITKIIIDRLDSIDGRLDTNTRILSEHVRGAVASEKRLRKIEDKTMLLPTPAMIGYAGGIVVVVWTVIQIIKSLGYI